MSITSLINPSGEISVQDDMWHIATSDNASAIDFKYVFDVYVNGEQLIRTKVFPEPSNNKGYFDASQVVRNEIKLNWFTPIAPIIDNSKSCFLHQPNQNGEIGITYNVQVGEDFSGVTTLNMASGQVNTYNWIPQLYNRRKQTSADFVNTFFTNRKFRTKIGFDERFLIGIKGNRDTIKLKLTTYDINNEEIDSRTQDYDYTLSLNNLKSYCQLDLGINALNSNFDDNVITSAVSSYSVVIAWFKKYNSTIVSKPFYFDIACKNKYKNINLYFINQWGMFDTARFNLVSKLSLATERKTYSKRDYSFGSSSVNYFDSNNVYNETKINYGSKTNWEYKLTMDFPTDDEWVWLQELIESPLIYADIDNNFYPVSIKDTNYEVNQFIWGGLKALELTIEMNQTRFGYRR